ncbi:MAG: succinylglutamate desuccinylase [Acidobacteria bacterium]|nr:MAG: succinylglutamate desuccinylase [Acidobacteriota bacterium]REK02149.1 MAG: succinylglutamate desuccinylase [Acidobacteriota bacterium]REK14049.1 MAG: succinylglutamate desuccinylase [Acidobacteriota bacterium]REK42044.1 MAG: succinylglutamate desuccinylase [Acidobacteriota bacterium]
MEILNTEVEPGQKAYLEMDVAALYTRTRISVPVIIERAKDPGPTLLVMGGIHGDEVNGIEIIRRLVFHETMRPSCGTVVALPIVNVMAFLNLSRKFADGRDLNRSFPGNKNGSLASKLANSITTRIVPHADYVVDLHTGSDEKFNYPQIRFDDSHEENLLLAKAFNAPFTIFTSSQRTGSMRRMLGKKGIPVIVFEGGKSRSINQRVVDKGMKGVLSVMSYLGMRPDEGPVTRRRSKMISTTKWVRSRSSGMLQPLVRNGARVEKGDLLAYVNGPYGQFQKKVNSPITGYVFCVNEAPVVYKGDGLFNIGSN